MEDEREAWNGEHPGELLSLHVDGDLSGEDRRRVEEHLQACPRCRRVSDDLREVADRAGRLPDRGPEQDLWPAVAGEIGGTDAGARTDAEGDGSGADGVVALFRRRWRVGPARAVAAAALVAALASGVTWGLTRGAEGGSPGRLASSTAPGSTDARSRPPAAPAGSGVRWATLEAMPRGVAELETRYRESREELDPATRRMLDRNLRLIDRAIAEAQRALSEHPDNSYLNRYLTQTMRRKAEFLSVAVRMTQAD